MLSRWKAAGILADELIFSYRSVFAAGNKLKNWQLTSIINICLTVNFYEMFVLFLLSCSLPRKFAKIAKFVKIAKLYIKFAKFGFLLFDNREIWIVKIAKIKIAKI